MTLFKPTPWRLYAVTASLLSALLMLCAIVGDLPILLVGSLVLLVFSSVAWQQHFEEAIPKNLQKLADEVIRSIASP